MPDQTKPTEACRSRWRALLALLLLVPVPTLGAAASMFWWPGTRLGNGVFAASKLWIVLLPAAWLLFVERGRWSWSPPRRGGFGVAAALGVMIALTMFGVYAATRHLGWLDPAMVAAQARKTGLDRLPFYLLGAVYWITLNSLMEEYVWRWFVFRQAETLLGGAGGMVVSAAAFTLHHVVALASQFSWPMTLLGSAGVFTGGAIWSWLFRRYRSIWPGYVSHAIVDVPIFVIGYWLIFPAPA
ncbi:MAG: CPBP family intramembrane metalloprotease [Verrucomicrobiales bacterium]|nr:CPBP family intramembrane metalloprotease [Verrucomicrobiales bacterium]MCP5528334.1 CPBP family intramembrane metalloprotease [Verrucomicrobiales bacterium]